MNSKPLIKKGYYLKARCIKDSQIAHAAPCVREIWDWILRETNHKDVKTTGIEIKRGQLIRTYKDIQDSLSWQIGWRKMTYSKSDCENAMKKLRSWSMITTQKTTRGLIITVLNYDKFQSPANYESHIDSHKDNHTPPQTCHTINKNDKNEKNEKKDIDSRFAPPSLLEVSDYIKANNLNVNPDQWWNFYEGKGWMVGRNKMKKWKSAVQTWHIKNSNGRTNMCEEEAFARKIYQEQVQQFGQEKGGIYTWWKVKDKYGIPIATKYEYIYGELE